MSKARDWIFEAVMILIFSLLLADLLSRYSRAFVNARFDSLIPILTHIPMFLLPWLWLTLRVIPRDSRFKLGRGRSDSKRKFFVTCSWLLPLMLLLNLDVMTAPAPVWYRNGAVSIVLELFFQGLFVGLSEEMLMRVCIHQALLVTLSGGIRIFRWRLPHAVWITALIFGGFHLTNLGRQALSATVLQVVFTCFVGLVIGLYYQRTRSFVGAVFLHSIVDLPAVILVLLHQSLGGSL